MTAIRLIRDYENSALPLERRLPSLARRFPCLCNAPGLEPFSPERFRVWIADQGRDSAAWHAGHLILNLFGDGPWDKFDAVGALGAFEPEDRDVFANWVRCWQ